MSARVHWRPQRSAQGSAWAQAGGSLCPEWVDPPPPSGSARVLALSLKHPRPQSPLCGRQSCRDAPITGSLHVLGGHVSPLFTAWWGTWVSGFLGVLRAASDPAPAGLQCERQAGGISPIGPPRPIHGTAVLPARGARDWRDDASSGSFSAGVVTTHAAAVSPQRACWPCCQRVRGWEWPELRSGVSSLGPEGLPLQQSRRRPWRRPWRLRELPPGEARRAGSWASLLSAPLTPTQ